jgi:hypothetical protein
LSDLESAALARQKLGLPALAKDGEPDQPLASADAYQAIAQRESHAFGLLNALIREQPAVVAQTVAAIRHHSPASISLLDALSSSNSGDILALPSVRPFLSSDQDSLRLAAVLALRLMDSPEAASLVAERLNKDSASIVRDAALDAARVRAGVGASRVPPVLLAAVDAQARTSSDSHSRLQAVRLLTAWLPREPELRQTLGSVVKNDQEQNIRETGQRALGS